MSEIEDRGAPDNRHQAANWLAQRHDRVRYIAARLDAAYGFGSLEDQEAGGIDPDRIAQAVYDAAEHARVWEDWERRNPPPRGEYDDARYEAWVNSGPEPTWGAAAFGPMSSGEKGVARLLATLGVPHEDADGYNSPIRRAGWALGDVSSFDRDAAAILDDWLAIVRAQLPNTLYPPAGPRVWIETGSGPGWSPR